MQTKEQRKAYKREWNRRNREKMSEYFKEWYSKRDDEWKQRHREKSLEYYYRKKNES